MSNGNIFVERRPDGNYAVEKPGAERASAILPTQSEAIERAKEISPGSRPDVGASETHDQREAGSVAEGVRNLDRAC